MKRRPHKAVSDDPTVTVFAIEERINEVLDKQAALGWPRLLYDAGAEWAANALESPWGLAFEAPSIISALDRFIANFAPHSSGPRIVVPEYVEAARQLRGWLELCSDPERIAMEGMDDVRTAWNALRQAAANGRIKPFDLVNTARNGLNARKPRSGGKLPHQKKLIAEWRALIGGGKSERDANSVLYQRYPDVQPQAIRNKLARAKKRNT